MTDEDAGRPRAENRGSRRRSQWTVLPGRAPEQPEESAEAANAQAPADDWRRSRVVRFAVPVMGAVAIGALVTGIVSSQGAPGGGQPAAQSIATKPTVVASLVSGGGRLSELTPSGSAAPTLGPSAGSRSATAAPSVPASPPQAVTDLAAASLSTEAALSWTAVPHATGYYVYVRNLTKKQSAYSKLPLALTSSPWTAGLLTNGDTYQFRLQSMNGSLAGGMSNVATVEPSGPVPGGITDLAAAPANGGAKLTWTNVANSSGYLVYQRDVTNGQAAFSQLPYPLWNSPWTAGLLINGHTYQFELRSTNGDEMGGFSNVVTVVPNS
jgi:hypothetical protein